MRWATSWTHGFIECENLSTGDDQKLPFLYIIDLSELLTNSRLLLNQPVFRLHLILQFMPFD